MESHHANNPMIGGRYYALVRSSRLETSREQEYDYHIIKGHVTAIGKALKEGSTNPDDLEDFVEIAGQRVRADCVYSDIVVLMYDLDNMHRALEEARAADALPQPTQ